MSSTEAAAEQQKKKERKEKLKAEADKLGISYKELKEQKKEAKSKKKRSREAESLDTSEHKSELKRMRSWSKDGNDKTSSSGDAPDSKRRRTRSMDAKEEEKALVDAKTDLTPAEWRKENSITIRGHGKYRGKEADDFPKPFLKFTDAPFSQAILRSFDEAGFKAPTCIQSQVCTSSRSHLKDFFYFENTGL